MSVTESLNNEKLLSSSNNALRKTTVTKPSVTLFIGWGDHFVTKFEKDRSGLPDVKHIARVSRNALGSFHTINSDNSSSIATS